MTRTRQGTVYALIDPRDSKIRYIGKTTQPILNRLGGHLAKPTNPAMRVWINGLNLGGLIPHIEVVATTTEERLDAEEQRQISRHIKQGHRLLNAPYYQQHMADLSRIQSADPVSEADKAERWPPAMGLARLVFGRLARARAARQVPAWAVALIVMAGAPLYLVLLMLRTVFNTRAGIYAVILGGFGSILWDAGFDAAVRDLLLPRLPVEESLTLWSTYVAPPLAELAPSFGSTTLIISIMLAGASYAEVAKSAPRPARARKSEDVVGAAAAALESAIPPAVKGLAGDPKA